MVIKLCKYVAVIELLAVCSGCHDYPASAGSASELGVALPDRSDLASAEGERSRKPDIGDEIDMLSGYDDAGGRLENCGPCRPVAIVSQMKPNLNGFEYVTSVESYSTCSGGELSRRWYILFLGKAFPISLFPKDSISTTINPMGTGRYQACVVVSDDFGESCPDCLEFSSQL